MKNTAPHQRCRAKHIPKETSKIGKLKFTIHNENIIQKIMRKISLGSETTFKYRRFCSFTFLGSKEEIQALLACRSKKYCRSNCFQGNTYFRCNNLDDIFLPACGGTWSENWKRRNTPHRQCDWKIKPKVFIWWATLLHDNIHQPRNPCNKNYHYLVKNKNLKGDTMICTHEW